ncbi:MAG: hypothetical protein JOS17DRAFT_762302, partial [Linnemannia elongata]
MMHVAVDLTQRIPSWSLSIHCLSFLSFFCLLCQSFAEIHRQTTHLSRSIGRSFFVCPHMTILKPTPMHTLSDLLHAPFQPSPNGTSGAFFFSFLSVGFLH